MTTMPIADVATAVGYASALSLIFFIIVLAFALIQRALTKED